MRQPLRHDGTVTNIPRERVTLRMYTSEKIHTHTHTHYERATQDTYTHIHIHMYVRACGQQNSSSLPQHLAAVLRPKDGIHEQKKTFPFSSNVLGLGFSRSDFFGIDHLNKFESTWDTRDTLDTAIIRTNHAGKNVETQNDISRSISPRDSDFYSLLHKSYNLLL